MMCRLLDRFLNWLIPPMQNWDVLAPNPVAEAEQACESFEPDELWAAMQRHPAGVNRQPPGTERPRHASGLYLISGELLERK